MTTPMLNCHPPSNGAPLGLGCHSAVGDATSAAPTTQRHYLSFEVRDDRPPESNAPEIGKPNG